MARIPSMIAVLMLFVAPSLVRDVGAQTSAPGHQHYEPPPKNMDAPAPGMPLAPRLQNLGVHTFPSSTKVERTQLFINQGLNLIYAFNHAESARAFAEAARLDATLAIAYWGLKKNAESGCSLGGLVQALRAQGRSEEAALAEARLHRAWRHADLPLPGVNTTADAASRPQR